MQIAVTLLDRIKATMEDLTNKIYEIIKDYHCDEQAPIAKQNISNWINQFGEDDREFILSEFLHLLSNGIYVSKSRAKDLLWQNFCSLATRLGYRDKISIFLEESNFFNMQGEGKSQTVLFAMLNETVKEQTGLQLNSNNDKARNFIYIDDIVATGKTVLRDFKTWLKENNNYEKVISGEYNLCLSVFCIHHWALDNLHWALKCEFSNEAFMKSPSVFYNYLIDNRVQLPWAKLNLAVPIKKQSKEVLDYFDSIDADKYPERAFRPDDRPKTENFYSSVDNRHRFETLLLEKGVGIVKKIKQSNGAHRPLGDTYPHYKTLGTGTLFFTWRNISNTCPLVFWWDNPAHQWKGLFTLKGRGN